MVTRKSKDPGSTAKSKAEGAGQQSKTSKTRKTAAAAKSTVSTHNDLIVVGIGASAGGLEAYKHVLPGLPVDANMAFVLVQHLDPKHRSMMASLLDRHTEMDVLEIADGQVLEANHVYITPPGYDVKIVGSALHLSKPSSSIGPRPSIDYFLTSLAENKADRAVGIILSGTGSDGAHGIRAIKAGGGITIVQSEESARYNGMPRSAIETGHVDLVLDPGKIGKELQIAIKYPKLVPKVSPEAKSPKDIDFILHMIAERTGANLSEYKPSTINRRVGRRMALHKILDLGDYLRYVQTNPKELDLLLKDILISVTGFFRDAEAFQSLKRALAQLLKAKQNGDNIRVWVPGCATGEEAYSIAILLHEQLGNDVNRYNIQIFGTDLDQDAIIRARKGLYFNSSLQKKIVPMFHYILNPGGVLFLGKSESIGQFADLFVPVAKKWKIFQRRDTLRTPVVDFGLGKHPRYKSRGRIDLISSGKETPVKQIFAESVISTMANCAVMIDDRLEIMFVHGDVGPYLTLAQGEVGLNILNMARSAQRLDLRALIHKATRENRVVRSNKIKFKRGATILQRRAGNLQ